MGIFTAPLERLMDLLKRLPGIGPKSAQRIAFFLLRSDPLYIQQLLESVQDARRLIQLCQYCNNYTSREICEICSDARREQSIICIVEKPFDIAAVERSGQFHGTYHVLHGALSPIDGIGPDDLKLTGLFQRIKNHPVRELIVATDPDVEGEATAIYLAKLFKPLEIRVSRIALGLPVGTDLEYADEVTVGRALEGRTPL